MSDRDMVEVRRLVEQQADQAPRPSGLRPATVRRARIHRFELATVTCMALVAALIAGIRITSVVTEQNGKPRVVRIPPAKHKQTTEPLSDEIAFTRYAGQGAICVLNTDGQIRKLISEGPYAIAGPAWSSDGRKIAFHGFFGKASAANNGEGGGLFVINADGTHLKLLHLDGADPSWSPDGKRIAFWVGGHIYLTDADGHGLKVLTDKVQADLPTWSPDGTRIAFQGLRGTIYVLRPDGSHLHRIAGGHGLRLYDPAWSPDGAKIAVSRPGKGSKRGIYIMNTDGSGAAFLVRDAGEPAWSPDGTRIALTRNRRGHTHIYSINVDGTGLIQITHGPGNDSYPAWKP